MHDQKLKSTSSESPVNVTVTGLEVVAEQESVVRCTARLASPAPVLTWRLGDTVLSGTSQTDTEEPGHPGQMKLSKAIF